jgi:hypothetical protein
LRTNYDELQAILPTFSPKNYSSLDLFNTALENVIKTFIGIYSDDSKDKIKAIYEIK